MVFTMNTVVVLLFALILIPNILGRKSNIMLLICGIFLMSFLYYYHILLDSNQQNYIISGFPRIILDFCMAAFGGYAYFYLAFRDKK